MCVCTLHTSTLCCAVLERVGVFAVSVCVCVCTLHTSMLCCAGGGLVCLLCVCMCVCTLHTSTLCYGLVCLLCVCMCVRTLHTSTLCYAEGGLVCLPSVQMCQEEPLCQSHQMLCQAVSSC